MLVTHNMALTMQGASKEQDNGSKSTNHPLKSTVSEHPERTAVKVTCPKSFQEWICRHDEWLSSDLSHKGHLLSKASWPE